MKCTRCGHTMGKPEGGWVTCPKCGMAAFVGVKKAPEVKDDIEIKAEKAVEEKEE